MEQLGRYTLGARIATGGMAEVFLARSEGVQGFARTVVIKRLLPHLTRDPAVVEMFLNEARLTGRLDHPNVVQVLDLGEFNGVYYIAMELLDGRALSEVRDAARAKGGMLPVPFILRVVSEALAGLHHAHEARGEDGRPLEIVHRDFNPDNIVVTYDGRVKVVDFGIAKAQTNASSTEPGTLKGKYYYMSPEMVLGSPMDRRIDLFSAGVILYELLCDKRPYEGDTPNAILSGIAYGKAVAPRSLNPALSPALEAVIVRALAHAPEQRHATGKELKDELDGLLMTEQPFGTTEISQLMNLLFPLGQDQERMRIGELRKLDPSIPGTGAPLSAPIPSPQQPLPSQGRSRSMRPGPTHIPGARGNLLPMALVAVLVVALGAVTASRFMPGKDGSKGDAPPVDKMAYLKQQAGDHPEQPALADRYADALVVADRDDDAEKVVTRVIADHPDDARAHAILGDLLQKKRFGQKALEEYEKALKLRPDDATTWEHLGNLQLARGDLPAAREAIGHAQAIKPSDRGLALKLVRLEERNGEWDKAIALLTPLSSRYPSDADVRAELGFSLLQSGDERRALSELLAAERIKPNGPRIQTYLANIYYHQGKTQKAIETYRAAISNAKDPGTAAPAHLALGQILAEKGDRDQARKEYGEALKGDPTLVEAQEGLKKLQ